VSCVHTAGALWVVAVTVAAATQAKRGLHSNKEVQVPRVNDVSTPGNGQRAKQYLPFLQRAGKLFGTVEMCSSGEWT
jgi:staphylococcal nuclease domain-containing protein 1